MRLIACLTLIAGLTLPGLTAAQSAAAPSVLVRTGQHATFNRLVFDWPVRVPYRISHSPGRATITFERPATLDLSRYRKRPPPLVKSFKPRPDQAGLTVGIEVPQGARLRHFVDAGTHVVLDVYGTAPAAEAAKVGRLVAMGPIAAPAVAAAPEPAATIRSAQPEAVPTKKPAPQKPQLAQAKSPESKNSDAGLDYLVQSDKGSSNRRRDGHGFSLGGNLSTLGLGVEAGYRFNDYFGVRVGGNYFGDYDFSEDYGGINYSAEISLWSVGGVVDIYPFRRVFRLTGGIRYNGNDFEVSTKPSGNLDIGGVIFTPAQVGTFTGKADFRNYAPYAGFGFEGSFFDNRFVLGADLGVLFQGSPNLDFTGTGTAANTAAFQNAIDQEIKDVEDDMEILGFFPVIGLSASYRF